nr:hypothetical protein [uncultured Gellertiella sp.]
MDTDLDQRIEAMYRRDVLGARLLVLVLWIAILFVLAFSWPHIPDAGVRAIVAIAAGAVLIFNTASVQAMVRNYREDKHFIYALDIRNLDAMREAKKM